MQTIPRILLSILMLFLSAPLLFAPILPVAAQTPEKRIALVIGNADYPGAPLQTPANILGSDRCHDHRENECGQ